MDAIIGHVIVCHCGVELCCVIGEYIHWPRVS